MNLNNEQRHAVEALKGPVMVIAGPGTGKTKLLTAKIAYLIETQSCQSPEILAVTFTRKAAQEIRDRLNIDIPVHTFHSLAITILKEAGEDSYKIVSESKQKEIVKEILKGIKKKGQGMTVRKLMLAISKYKNDANYKMDGTTEKIASKYNDKLQQQGLLDFDDLILNAYELLRNNENLRKRLKRKYKYFFIDEFQDTNSMQYELLKLLLDNTSNVTVIGDPRQSIYSFRGAMSSIFDQFKKDFSNVYSVDLTQNYRSTREILHVSSMLYPQVKLEPWLKETGEVMLVRTMNKYSEADWILRKISQLMDGLDLGQASDLNSSSLDSNLGRNLGFRDFAIIYRTHAAARAIESKLREVALPYQIVGAASIFNQKHISLVIDAMKTIFENQSNEIYSTKSLPELATEIITKNNIEAALKPSQLADLAEFTNLLRQFDSTSKPLESFLNYLHELEQRDYYDEDAEKLTLLTIHAAKGLEFKYVFICGLEEGLIPLTFDGQTAEDLEEEKRLLYVAMTRAKYGLYLTTARNRNAKKTQESRFIAELKCNTLIEREDEHMAKIEKRRIVWKAKKSQIGFQL